MRHCWESKDKLMSDVIMWTHHTNEQLLDNQLEPINYNSVWTQLCGLENLLNAMDDRDD